jgi:hypothetical protein
MSLKKTRFIKGIILAPDSVDLDGIEGEIKVDSSTGKIQVTLKDGVNPSVAREVLTNSQLQTITNKVINSDDNSISNIVTNNLKPGVLNTNITLSEATNTQIPSALAVRTYIDNVAAAQNEASEIAVFPVVGDAPNNNTVQKVLETHESRLDTAEINITGLTNNKVTGPASATDNALVRFDLTTGKLVQNSIAVLSDSGSLTGLRDVKLYSEEILDDRLILDSDGLRDVNTNNGLHIIPAIGQVDVALIGRDVILNGSTILPSITNATLQGSNALLDSETFSNVVLTNSNLVSIAGIIEKTDGGLLILTNYTNNDLEIVNNEPSTAGILTGTDGDITLRVQSSIMLVYSTQLSRWVVIGGTGGATSSVKLIAGENLSANDVVYQNKNNGLIYKAQANNDDTTDVLGFVRKQATANNTVEVVTGGVIKGFSNLLAGKLYYLREDISGLISDTPPSLNGNWVVSVGIAISETELVINPVPSSSAIYITDSEYVIGLPNNIASPDDITDLLFDPIQVRSFILDYSIYREDSLQAKAQVGQLRGVYNSRNGVWLLSDDFAGESTGVEFSIQPSGQVQYSTSNFTGTSHDCIMKYTIKRTFKI